MRDRLIDSLGELAHSRFLVYLMGPYKTFDVDALREASEEELVNTIPENVDFGTLLGSDAHLNVRLSVVWKRGY